MTDKKVSLIKKKKMKNWGKKVLYSLLRRFVWAKKVIAWLYLIGWK